MKCACDEDSKGKVIKKKNPVHILVIPLMAQGHMIPMLDLARLLASRGVLVSLVTTPANLARIRPVVDGAAASALAIRFVELPFPVAEFGIPEGCENTDMLPSLDLILPFLNALPLLQGALEAHLRAPHPENWPPPACIVSDNLHHWAADVARKLWIPRLIFHGTSCFFLLCNILIKRQRPELEAALAAGSGGPIALPGIPHPIGISKHQVNPSWDTHSGWTQFLETVEKVEKSADGVLVNSFTDIEPWYMDAYREATGKPVWGVGPVSLYKEGPGAKAARGRVSTVDRDVLFRWLDGQEEGSVVYVSFGSTVRLTAEQIQEVGCGLEASEKPFVWVVKEAGMTEWLTEFEKGVRGRGVVIREWAPQTLVLGHVAVGGFLTHCGWNSTLEAVAAGVVMATWPHFWDQFLNQSFVVDVLDLGVPVGVQPILLESDDEGVKVGREEVRRAVERLMDGGEEGEKRRERAREARDRAAIAMEEGGSSWQGIEAVISYMHFRD